MYFRPQQRLGLRTFEVWLENRVFPWSLNANCALGGGLRSYHTLATIFQAASVSMQSLLSELTRVEEIHVDDAGCAIKAVVDSLGFTEGLAYVLACLGLYLV